MLHPRTLIGATVALGVLLGFLWLNRSAPVAPIICPQAEQFPTQRSSGYTTSFALLENPIAEGGNWINGRAVGIEWNNVETVSGVALGTQDARTKQGSSAYDDSVALLTGTWNSDQSVEATVRSTRERDDVYQEVELRLRSSLSSHCASGYEINFRCSKSVNAYTEIVRWNGRVGDFTYLNRLTGTKAGVGNGDVVKASIIGNVLRAYVNGVEVLQAIDDTYANGNPGIGFYLRGEGGRNSDCGFTRLAAGL